MGPVKGARGDGSFKAKLACFKMLTKLGMRFLYGTGSRDATSVSAESAALMTEGSCTTSHISQKALQACQLPCPITSIQQLT